MDVGYVGVREGGLKPVSQEGDIWNRDVDPLLEYLERECEGVLG